MTEANNKNLCNTTHEASDENYLKESKNFTDEFLQIFNTKTNEPQNITNESNKKTRENFL